MTGLAESDETGAVQNDEAELSDVESGPVPPEAIAAVGPDGAPPEPVVSERSRPSNVIPFLLLAGFVLVALATAIAYIYLVQSPTSHHLPTLSDDEAASPSATIAPPPKPAPTLGRLPSGELIPVTGDMLRVTSIALGDLHLSIVNGKRLAEGDWLELSTPSGVTYVKLVRLEDGVAHFDYGGESIDSKLQLTLTPKNSPGPQPIPQSH